MTKKNYKIRDLMIDGEQKKDLDEASNKLKVRNTDLCRLFIHNGLKQLKHEGYEHLSIAIVGLGKAKKKGVRKNA